VPSASWLGRLQRKIHDHWAAGHSPRLRLRKSYWISINSTLRYIPGNVNTISRSGFVTQFQSRPQRSGPVFASGWTTMVPAHNAGRRYGFAAVIAATRVIPDICGAFMSNSSAGTILAPFFLQSMSEAFS